MKEDTKHAQSSTAGAARQGGNTNEKSAVVPPLTAPAPLTDEQRVPEGWEPVYLVWHDDIMFWVDDGLAEYEAAESQDRRIAYQPKVSK